MQKRPDWGAIADEYITGIDAVTHRYLAAKHEVSVGTLARRASREAWSRRRAEYRNQTDRKVMQKAAEKDARERIKQRERNRDALLLAQRRLIEALHDKALRSSSVDTASRTLCEVIRTLELLAGEPDSRQETEHRGGVKYVVEFETVEPTHDYGTGYDGGDDDTS